MKQQKKEKGITLIALVVTIIVLIILATISVNLVLGENGVIKKAELADEEYRKGQAREKLTLTLGSAGIDKKTKPEYNNDYLDGVILKEIPDAKILGDIVIVDGFAFEVDRSVPEIGKYVGKEEDLVFPEVSLSKTIAENAQTATITITAEEKKNGINKVEILQDGHVIATYPYENEEKVTLNFEAKRNGKYMVKVYGVLPVTKMMEVTELIAEVKYSPNGSEEYKKEHEVTITVDETVDKVKNIKYQWTDTTAEPAANTFTQSCANGEKIKKGELTGKWYLWVLVETESGKTRIEKSEAFHFDNEVPTGSLTSLPVTETSFTLTATARDIYSGIAKYEFYVNGKQEKIVETNEETVSCEVTVDSMDYYDSYVKVTDISGNVSIFEYEARTKMYTWDTYRVDTSTKYIRNTATSTTKTLTNGGSYNYYTTMSFSASSGFSGRRYTPTDPT